MNVIVVGVDHSEQAKKALRFALEEAKLRNAKLRVSRWRTLTRSRSSGAWSKGRRPVCS